MPLRFLASSGNWRDVNPREVNRRSTVYKSIVQTLTQDPERFHERNRGITAGNAQGGLFAPPWGGLRAEAVRGPRPSKWRGETSARALSPAPFVAAGRRAIVTAVRSRCAQVLPV